MLELRGDIVVLRPLRFDDAARLREIHAEPAVAAWWGSFSDDFPFDEPESTRFTIWAGDRIAGLIQYGEEVVPEYRHAWIDVFVSTEQHGKGIGSDAVRAVLGHLIDDRGHHRVTIDPAVENVAAVRAYEKAGFTRVGVMRAAERSPDGTWRDAVFMEYVDPGHASD